MDRKRSSEVQTKYSHFLATKPLCRECSRETRTREREEHHRSIRQSNSLPLSLSCREYNFLAPTTYIHAYTTRSPFWGSSGNASTRLQSISGARYYFESPWSKAMERRQTEQATNPAILFEGKLFHARNTPRQEEEEERRGAKGWKSSRAFDVSKLPIEGWWSSLHERQRTLNPRVWN